MSSAIILLDYFIQHSFWKYYKAHILPYILLKQQKQDFAELLSKDIEKLQKLHFQQVVAIFGMPNSSAHPTISTMRFEMGLNEFYLRISNKSVRNIGE
jgi:hypothetical protein